MAGSGASSSRKKKVGASSSDSGPESVSNELLTSKLGRLLHTMVELHCCLARKMNPDLASMFTSTNMLDNTAVYQREVLAAADDVVEAYKRNAGGGESPYYDKLLKKIEDYASKIREADRLFEECYVKKMPSGVDASGHYDDIVQTTGLVIFNVQPLGEELIKLSGDKVDCNLSPSYIYI